MPGIDLDPEAAGLAETWKLPSIRAYVRDRPFAWVDDEIGPDAHAWARDREHPTLLLDIPPDCGLSEDHADQLVAFAEQVSAG